MPIKAWGEKYKWLSAPLRNQKNYYPHLEVKEEGRKIIEDEINHFMNIKEIRLACEISDEVHINYTQSTNPNVKVKPLNAPYRIKIHSEKDEQGEIETQAITITGSASGKFLTLHRDENLSVTIGDNNLDNGYSTGAVVQLVRTAIKTVTDIAPSRGYIVRLDIPEERVLK